MTKLGIRHLSLNHLFDIRILKLDILSGLVWVVFLFNIGFSFPQADTIKKSTPASSETDFIKSNPYRAKAYYKSPGLAMLFSAVIPGGGQLYCKNYWKSIIFIGAEGTLGYLAYKNHRNFEDTHNIQARNQRNNFLWWVVSVKLLSIADAYVSANMYKFKDQMKLSFDFDPKRETISIRIGFRIIKPVSGIGLLRDAPF